MKTFSRLNIRKVRRRKELLLYILLLIFVLIYLYKILFNNSPLSCFQLTKANKIFDNFQLLNEYPHTLCSERATKHGLHQRIISVSAYPSRKDNKNLIKNIWLYTIEYIKEAQYFYPDWRVRVYYHDINKTIDEIIQIENYYKNVDFCDVFNIPFLGNIHSYMSGRLHRFIPIADHFVDIYMSRDIDSPILQREIVSVNQWLLSNKLYHIIRDHPLHYDVILAGLWAFKVYQNETMRNELRKRLLSKSIINCYNPMSGDLDFIYDYIWPIAQNQSLQHDSFHCQQFPLSIPFTTPKLSMTHFIGCRRPCRSDQDSPGPCPIQCISSNNTDPNLC